MKQLKQRGGWRPGAGRKPMPGGGARQISATLPATLVAWLDRQPGANRSDKLRRVLYRYLADRYDPVLAGQHVLLGGVVVADSRRAAVNASGKPIGASWAEAVNSGGQLRIDDTGRLYVDKRRRPWASANGAES